MTFGRVLIALDESALAAHAVTVGCDLAKALNADVALVYVVDPALAYLPEGGIPAADLMAELKHEGERLLSAAAKRLGDNPTWHFLREGKPADEVLAAAREWNADLIVIGTHGRSGVSRLVMGSTAESVLRRATCPILVVKASEQLKAGGWAGAGPLSVTIMVVGLIPTLTGLFGWCPVYRLIGFSTK